MFQYALLLGVAAAASYTKAGPSNEKEGATSDDAATVLQTTEFTEAISKTTNDTKVLTTSTIKASNPGTSYSPDDIKESSAGICYETGTGIIDGDATSTNKYTCTIATVSFTASGAQGFMERYQSDELPWSGTIDDNMKKDCKQEFTWDKTNVKITSRSVTDKTQYPCANTADLTTDDVAISTSSWSVKTVYTDPATYTTETSAEQVTTLETAMKKAMLWSEVTDKDDKVTANNETVDMTASDEPDDEDKDKDKDKDGAATFALAGATMAAAAFMF